ncbi:MAG: RNA polymerase sigma factor [Saprospiraceae bacterium]|nr:RNA polymerase sigma factor [Saprospiraceae bacterium]
MKNTSDKMSDEEIVERILKGEQQLLEQLYDRYSGKIFHKCLSIIKDREAAKDCTHDITIKIFMNLANFKGRSAFSLWVHSITYNYCMDYLTKQKRMDYSDYSDYEYENVANDDEALESKLLQDLKLTQLEAVFEKLNPDEKIILMMRYQDGMSVKDIADTLSIGESAVKMRLKRSRDRLAELIEELDKKQGR